MKDLLLWPVTRRAPVLPTRLFCLFFFSISFALSALPLHHTWTTQCFSFPLTLTVKKQTTQYNGGQYGAQLRAAGITITGCLLQPHTSHKQQTTRLYHLLFFQQSWDIKEFVVFIYLLLAQIYYIRV